MVKLYKAPQGRKGFVLFYSMWSISGTSGQKPEVGTDTEAMEVCSSWLVQPAFLYNPGPPAHGRYHPQ